MTIVTKQAQLTMPIKLVYASFLIGRNSMGVRTTKDAIRIDMRSTDGNRDSIPSPNKTTIATLHKHNKNACLHTNKSTPSYPIVINSTTNITLTNVLTRSPKAAAPMSPYVVELGQASRQRAISLAV